MYSRSTESSELSEPPTDDIMSVDMFPELAEIRARLHPSSHALKLSEAEENAFARFRKFQITRPDTMH